MCLKTRDENHLQRLTLGRLFWRQKCISLLPKHNLDVKYSVRFSLDFTAVFHWTRCQRNKRDRFIKHFEVSLKRDSMNQLTKVFSNLLRCFYLKFDLFKKILDLFQDCWRTIDKCNSIFSFNLHALNISSSKTEKVNKPKHNIWHRPQLFFITFISVNRVVSGGGCSPIDCILVKGKGEIFGQGNY